MLQNPVSQVPAPVAKDLGDPSICVLPVVYPEPRPFPGGKREKKRYQDFTNIGYITSCWKRQAPHKEPNCDTWYIHTLIDRRR